MLPLLLNATWILPLLAIPLACAIPAHRVQLMRLLSLGVALAVMAMITCLTVIYLVRGPDPGFESGTALRLAFVSRFSWFEGLGVEFFTGADGISLLMMLMAGVIAICGILMSWRIEDRAKEFHVLLLVLLAGTFGCFITFDLFTFFLFNEITLIPTYLLIGIFGSGQRERAAMKLNLMLFGGSALIIVAICGLYVVGGSFDLLALASSPLIRDNPAFQAWAFPCLFLGFAVLGSLFPFHTWSPAGHSAAPTAISMFLAGVHMKLGGYGCLRAGLYLMPEGAASWMPVFLVLATVSVVYGAFIAVRHRDLKFINAYASISHVGLVVFAFAGMSLAGLRGGVLQMISHGFVTALVFALIGAIYLRTHTRRVDEMGGLMASMPFLSVALVVAGFAVIGVPGSSSFVAEFTIFTAGFGAAADPLRIVCTIACVLTIVVTAVYVLRSVNRVVNGPPVDHLPSDDAHALERAPVILLLGCILLMGLMPGWMIGLIDGSLTPIIDNLAR